MVPISLTLGPQVVCSQISSCLFGLMTLQTYLYFYNFPNDTLRLKLLVAVLWLFKAAHWCLSTASLYELSVNDSGNPKKFNILPIPLDVSFIITGCLYFVTQSFFCHRVHVISGKWYLSALCWILAVTRVITIFVLCALIIKLADLERFAEEYMWLLVFMFVNGVVGDALIAILQSYFLWRKGRSRVKKTQDIVETLMRWTIQTGTVTCLLTITVIITLTTMTKTWIWLGLMNVAPGVWANTLMASLNGRVVLTSRNNPNISLYADPYFSNSTSDVQSSIPVDMPHWERGGRVISQTMSTSPGESGEGEYGMQKVATENV